MLSIQTAPQIFTGKRRSQPVKTSSVHKSNVSDRHALLLSRPTPVYVG